MLGQLLELPLNAEQNRLQMVYGSERKSLRIVSYSARSNGSYSHLSVLPVYFKG